MTSYNFAEYFRVSQKKVYLYKHQLINSARVTNTHSDHAAIKSVPRGLTPMSIKLPQAESGMSLKLSQHR